MRSIYNDIQTEKDLSSSSRSVDVKKKLLETFGDTLIFKQTSSKKSELIVSKENKNIFNAENVVPGLPCSVLLKKVGKIVCESVNATTRDSS